MAKGGGRGGRREGESRDKLSRVISGLREEALERLISMVDDPQTPVQAKLIFRGNRHRFRGGTRRAGVVLQLPPSLCLYAHCCNELP